MEFVETAWFTARITALLDDDAYGELQAELICRPKAGTVIPGTGGLRKLRWRAPDRGKRGGLRVIYYYCSGDLLYLIFVYDKTTQENLTGRQMRLICESIKGELT